jgi:hypothetical protein
MVRRGSTVRVRQRALQTPRKSGLFVRIDLLLVDRAVAMELFRELSVSERLRNRVSSGNTGFEPVGNTVAMRQQIQTPAVRAASLGFRPGRG